VNSHFTLTDTAADYDAVAAAYEVGGDIPVPRQFADRLPRGRHPRGRQSSWAGVVAHLADTAATRSAAELLAAGTGRSLVVVDAPEDVLALSGEVVLVADASRISEHLLGRIADQEATVSLLVGRTAEAIQFQVAKSLGYGYLEDSSAVLDPFALVADPSLPTTDDVRAFNKRGASLLLSNTHGRECLMHLEDGVICGLSRRTALTSNLPADLPAGLTSCLQGEGCYRLGYQQADREIIAADDVNCAVLWLNTCLGQKSGNGQFPASTTLTLSLLEGACSAVVGSPHLRSGTPGAGSVFRALVQNGASLSESVRQVNGLISESRDGFGTFMILGDGAWRPYPARTIEPTQPTDTREFDCDSSGHWFQGRASDWIPSGGVALADCGGDRFLCVPLEGRSTLTLSRAPVRSFDERMAELADAGSNLSRLWIHGLATDGNLTEFRSSMQAAVEAIPYRSAQTNVMLKRAGQALRAADRLIAQALTVETVRRRFHFMDTWLDGSTRDNTDFEARCPECGRDATSTRWTHRAVNYSRKLLSCPLCGEVVDTPADGFVSCWLDGPRTVPRGSQLEQRLHLTNSSQYDVSVAAGVAVLHQDWYGSEADLVSEVIVPARGQTTIDVSFTVPSTFRVADRHGLRAFAVTNGQISAYSRYFWVTK
jgi:hypothetical protein